MNCKICSNEAHIFTHNTILYKYDVAYYKCNSCGFVQTEEPYWLEEAYSQAINCSDIGILSRNSNLSKVTGAIIFAFYDKKKKFIDYGGGYGFLVRMMRDLGYDFYWHDTFCKNLVARGFEHNEADNTQYEIVTAFEVFEHLVNPLNDIEKIIKLSKNILFTTELLTPNVAPPKTWWYYGNEHGQHISFYTRKTLSVIAEKCSLNLYTNGKSIHLLTAKKISPFLFNVISKYKIAALLKVITGRKSLITEDYNKITGQNLF